MEQTPEIQPNPTPQPQSLNSSLHSTKLPFILGSIIVIIVIIGVGFIGAFRKNTPPAQKSSAVIPAFPTAIQTQKKNSGNFFFFSIPKPLRDITLTELPNDGNPKNVVEINDHLWFAGDGSIIEFDTKSGKLVSYSDPKKANCDSDIIFIKPYIYASCRIDNIEDAFGHTTQLHTKLYTGHQGVLKINPATHTLEHIFSKADGLLNGYNYELTPDGNTIWIATFNGVGKINTTTDHVDFYTTELGFQNSSNAISYSVNPILVDKDYVWAWNTASSKSQGGIAVYNKALGTWKAFGPRELKDSDFSRIDLEFSNNGFAAKLIPGGIQIGFRDGNVGQNERYVEKQYNYETGKWTNVNNERVATGIDSTKTMEYVASTYPGAFNFQKVDENGLTQIQLPGSSTIYQLDGRNNYVLSPMIGNKRYVLTDATVDVIDDTSPFRQILVKLGERLESGIYYADSSAYEELVHFLIDPDSLLAVVIDTQCGGQGCRNAQKAWLIDLKNKKINKIYTQVDDLPTGDLMLNKLSMDRTGNLLVVKNEDGKPIFNIDITTYTLTPLAK